MLLRLYANVSPNLVSNKIFSVILNGFIETLAETIVFTRDKIEAGDLSLPTTGGLPLDKWEHSLTLAQQAHEELQFFTPDISDLEEVATNGLITLTRRCDLNLIMSLMSI